MAKELTIDRRKVTMQAKCIMGHKFTLDTKAIENARQTGCAMCPTCQCPAYVTGIKLGKD